MSWPGLCQWRTWNTTFLAGFKEDGVLRKELRIQKLEEVSRGLVYPPDAHWQSVRTLSNVATKGVSTASIPRLLCVGRQFKRAAQRHRIASAALAETLPLSLSWLNLTQLMFPCRNGTESVQDNSCRQLRQFATLRMFYTLPD